MKKVIFEVMITIISIVIAIILGHYTEIASPDTIADTALTVSTVFCWTFTILYLLRSSWYSSKIGKIYASQNLALSLVLTQNCFSSWTDYQYAYRDEIRIVLFSLLTYSVSKMVTFLIQQQSLERQDRAYDSSDSIDSDS